MALDYSKFVQDNYLRPDEIDGRNTARLLAILDKWEADSYTSLWHVLHDVYDVVSFINPLYWQQFENPSVMAKDYINREQDSYRPYIKPHFLSDLNSSAVKDALRMFRSGIEDGDDMNSFAIGAAIFEAISIDGDGGPAKEKQTYKKDNGDIDWEAIKEGEPPSNPFHSSIATLRVQSYALRNPPPKTDIKGLLDPEPESVMRTHLTQQMAEFHAWCAEQNMTGPLIGNIIVDATGSAPFRPHVFNYNYLPDGPQKDAIFAKGVAQESCYDLYDDGYFFDFGNKEFDPRFEYHKEYIYPSAIVHVTTYVVKLFPVKAEDINALKALTQKALEILQTVEQRFGDPVGYSAATPYKRPDPLFIKEAQGGLEIIIRMDLDDLYSFYYLLEDMIVPSASIAQAFNAARFAEGRSIIKTFDDLGQDRRYSAENSPKVDQLGLIRKNASPPLEQALRDIFDLYAIGHLDEKGLVQQTMSMADMTLMGRITNTTRTLLTYDGMTALADAKGHDIVPYPVALKHLTNAFMKAMAGVNANTPVPSIGAMISQATSRERYKIISDLQEHDKEDLNDIRDRVNKSSSTFNISEFMRNLKEEEEKALALSDALAGYVHDSEYYRPKEDGTQNRRDRAVMTTARLVIRDPEIEPCITRTFDGTPYTSRMSGSDWPRKELPTSLQPFLKPEQTHTPAQQALLSFILT